MIERVVLQPPSRIFGDLGDTISQGLASSAVDSLAKSTKQPERSCKHCGKRLASWNESGYCTEHHRESDRVEKQFCRDCGERLRSDTESDRCLQCRLENLPEKRFCWACLIEDGPVLAMPLSRWLTERGMKWPASGVGLTKAEMQFLKSEYGMVICGGRLNSPNEHGYCPKHHYLTRLKPVWGRCQEPDCSGRINLTTNTTGHCRRHRFPGNRPSRQTQFCKECKGGPLPADNTTGYCPKHAHLARRPRKKPRTCTYEYPDGTKCQSVIGFGSRSGLCEIHRNAVYRVPLKDAAAKRTADHRARQQEKMAKLETDTEELKLRLLPDDCDDKGAWWEIGGNYLKRHRDASNQMLWAQLDKKGIRRKNGESWLAASKTHGHSVMNDTNDLRRWAIVPGRALWKKPGKQ